MIDLKPEDTYLDYGTSSDYDDGLDYNCDNPYENDEPDIFDEREDINDSDDYLRDELGNVIHDGLKKIKKGDVNFEFSKRGKTLF